MSIISFQEIINSIEKLSIDEQDYLFELIKKRRIEKQRLEIASNAQATLESLKKGTAKIGSVDDLIADLLDERVKVLEFLVLSTMKKIMIINNKDKKYECCS